MENWQIILEGLEVMEKSNFSHMSWKHLGIYFGAQKNFKKLNIDIQF